jgi:putative methionine-R-sulfoxide reductase with GAF domain
VHAWVGLKKKPGGFEIQGGRMVTSQTVNMQDLAAQQAIMNAVEKLKCELFPQIPRSISGGKIRSAIICPICHDKSCIGVLYAENSTQHEHYTQADLDYLITLSILASATMEIL